MSLSVKGFKLSNGNVVRYDYSSLDNIVTDATLSVSGTAADAGAVGLELSGIMDDLGDLSDEVELTNQALADKVDGAYADAEGYLYLTSNGEVVVGPIGPFAGGGSGSGSGNNASITVANTTGWLSTTISETEQCYLSFNWTSEEDDFPTGDGSVAIRVNGVVKAQENIQQGNVSINVREYLVSGSNVVRLTISDIYGNSRTLSFSISLVALSISAEAFEQSNASATYNSAVTFTYIPVGAVTKNVTFKLDSVIIGTQQVTTSGRQQTFTIPNQTHGSHSLEIYFTAEVNGVTVESNHLYFELIFVVSGNTTPIIASPFNATGATQYYTIAIPYTVYTPGSANSQVSFSATIVDANEETTTTNLGTRTVGRTQQTFTYTPNKVGTLTLTITTGSVSKSFVLNVAQLNIDVEAETDSLELYLSAEGRSNSEAYPGTWTYNDISCVFEHFNYVSDGWSLDAENSTCLKVTGDARLTIPFKMFQNDFRSSGKTIEFDFSTSDVRNYDTVLVSCMAEGKGFEITPQRVTLTGSDNTITTTQYKEDEHVRITFVIEKLSEHRLIYTYINGICSGIIQYASTVNFQQSEPVNITIGSNDCTINLYTIRVYNNSLPRHQVLDNWIADTPNGATMLARYNHNNIYDEYGEIVINKLPNDLPYLIIESPTLPAYKGDKKTISGSYTNPIDETKSFTFTDASMDVQGTSSAGYPRKNYKIKFKNFVNNDGESSKNYYLRGSQNSLPTNVFCFKADYASSEGANNVELVRLYNDSCPYQTPPQEDDELVRQGIDGVPIVIFWSNTNAGTTSFLGKYNFNFDKSSKVFGFDEGDESWETTDNSNAWALFKNADYTGSGWLNGYEARYPDTDPAYEDPTNLSAMATWVNSTDRDAAPYNIREPAITINGGGYNSNGTFNVMPSTSVWSKLGIIESDVFYWSRSEIESSSLYDSETNTLSPRSLGNINFQIYNPTVYSTLVNEGYTTNNQNSVYYFFASTPDKTYRYLNSYYGDYLTATSTYAKGVLININGTTSAGVEHLINDGMMFVFPVFEDEKDNFVLYFTQNNSDTILPIGIKNGDIVFAGKNTPYYGKKNINDAAVVDFDTPITYEGTQYTFDSAQYRLAKFRNELTNYFNKDDVLFYYLFTELFLMIDSRVKNSFPTLYASHQGAKWCWLPYDMDTAIGINNEGKLAFDYNLEDIDAPSKIDVIYNGRDTVMWNNVRDAFPNELRSMYQSVRADGIISYDNVEQRFENHQNTWPEAIFNEDAYFKYVKPFIDDGEDNLGMCLGSKEQQRKWWLYNRFRYIDSKYTAGYASASYMQARVYQKSDLTITPYADIYASASFDSNLVKARAPRGVATVVASPDGWDPGGADAVLRIYSADQIKSLGDLSGFLIGDISFAAATKLQEVKLGDANANYSNTHLVTVTFGNNTLLKDVDIRNCPNLVQVVDLSGCINLETAHFEGTSIAGVLLPDGGNIKELYLPNTITSLIIKNQQKLETVELAGTSNLTTLWLENVDFDIIDGLDIIQNSMANSGRAIRLVGFDKTYTNDSDFNDAWEKIRYSFGLNDDGSSTTEYAYLDGEVTVNELTRGIYDALSNYPFLTINYTTLGDYMYKLYLENSNKFTKYSDSTITKFRPYAFEDSVVISINCPNVTELGSYALEVRKGNYEYHLTSLILGQLTTVRKYAFAKINTSLLANIDLSHVTIIDGDAFSINTNWPTSLGFDEIRLPSLTTVNTTGNNQFANNWGHVSLIDIPNGVTVYNGSNAQTTISGFSNNNYLTALILRSTTMLYLYDNSSTFSNSPIRQAGQYSTVGQGYVYVPSTLVNTYKADWANKSNLSGLVDYIRAIEDYPEICDPNY